MRKNLLKIFVVFCVSLFMFRCSNNTASGRGYNNFNNYYNEKNQTRGRSVLLDTVIATTLFNNPEIIPSWHKSKTKSKTSRSTNTVSTATANGITTRTHSKTKTKSVTTGIGISPNLDFYTR